MVKQSAVPDAFSVVESATLEQLMEQFPDEWNHTGEAMVAALGTGRMEEAAKFLERYYADAGRWRERVRQGGFNPRVVREALPYVVRAQMARLALMTISTAAATGQKSGTVRMGLWSGYLTQRLLFERGLQRKPVSMRFFRLCWPLVLDRRLLLSAGTQITSTDNYSWSSVVTYPSEVKRLDALEALRLYTPGAVVCSWPPPGNRFERAIFSQPQVEIYIVLLSRHKFASGAWDAYQEQQSFGLIDDIELSRLVLPPEINPAVLVFRRR